jgi:hypothetical protein
MIYSFGEFELNDVQVRLTRGGQSVKLEPKVFSVLLYPLQNRDRVVTKNDLFDALWPGEFVTESALPRAVTAARRAVGDDRTQQWAPPRVQRASEGKALGRDRAPAPPPLRPGALSGRRLKLRATRHAERLCLKNLFAPIRIDAMEVYTEPH